MRKGGKENRPVKTKVHNKSKSKKTVGISYVRRVVSQPEPEIRTRMYLLL